MLAEGNVVFDKGEDQRITGTRGEWNYKTKLGYFVDSTGFTNQTNDGTVIYFTADRVERVAEDEIVIKNGKFTACEDAVPQWSFTAKEASIKTNDRLKLKNDRVSPARRSDRAASVCFDSDGETRPSIRLFNTDFRLFGGQGFPAFDRLLSNPGTFAPT